MTFHIITIFPEIFNSYLNESILKRAQADKKIKIKIYNLRDWTTDKHKTVDDTPYGGGAGMLMKVDVLYKAIQAIKSEIQNPKSKIRTILTSAKGKTWNQKLAQEYKKLDNLVIICGRYEGVDERITKFIDEEISIGDYVLTGGEIPAMVMVDSITRLLPGVLGNAKSLAEESFNEIENCKLPACRQGRKIVNSCEYPQYTRPEVFEAEGKKYKVPKVLLSGDHGKIEKWRKKMSKKKK